MTTKTISGRSLDQIEAATKRLNDELVELRAKQITDPDDAGINRRIDNVLKALDRVTQEYTDHVLAGVQAGGYSIESGDGAAGAAGDRKARRRLLAGRGAHAKGALAEEILDAGFDVKNHRSVELSGAIVLDALKASTFPDVDEWAPQRSGQIIPIGMDRRFLWPFLASQAADGASIEDFSQTGRTVTGTVQRSLNATTDKAKLDVAVELVNAPLVQFAVTIDDIPNAVLESIPSFTAFMQTEGTYQLQRAIDAHVLAQITAAGPAQHLTGDNLIEHVRHGIAAMRAVGAAPSIAVLDATAAAGLDLFTTGADDAYVFPTAATGTSSPLWNQRIVELPELDAPMLIDPAMLGVLYLGSVSFEADPYTGFRKNLTTLRIEVDGLFHVRNIAGALVLEAEDEG